MRSLWSTSRPPTLAPPTSPSVDPPPQPEDEGPLTVPDAPAPRVSASPPLELALSLDVKERPVSLEASSAEPPTPSISPLAHATPESEQADAEAEEASSEGRSSDGSVCVEDLVEETAGENGETVQGESSVRLPEGDSVAGDGVEKSRRPKKLSLAALRSPWITATKPKPAASHPSEPNVVLGHSASTPPTERKDSVKVTRLTREAHVLLAVLSGHTATSTVSADVTTTTFVKPARLVKSTPNKTRRAQSSVETKVVPHVPRKELKKLKAALMNPVSHLGLHLEALTTTDELLEEAIAFPSVGDAIGDAAERSGAFDLAADATRYLVHRSDEEKHPSQEGITIFIYWWGYEICLPPPTVRKLGEAQFVAHYVLRLAALFKVGRAAELAPFLRAISSYLDLEYKAIKSQDKGRGVVIAATWLIPVALVPRPWDFPAPPALPASPGP